MKKWARRIVVGCLLVTFVSLPLVEFVRAQSPGNFDHLFAPVPWQYNPFESWVGTFQYHPISSRYPAACYVRRINPDQTWRSDTAVDVNEDCRICFQMSADVFEGDEIDIEAQVWAKCQGGSFVHLKTFKCYNRHVHCMTPVYFYHEQTQSTFFGVPGQATVRLKIRFNNHDGPWSPWDNRDYNITVNQVTE